MNPEFGNPKTWDDTINHLKKTHRGFCDLIDRRIDELKLDEEDRRRFEGLQGWEPMEGQLRFSDLNAHFRFAEFVAKEVRHLNQVSPDLDFYHLILLADEGNMSDRTPLFPLRLLKRKADKAMRKAGLDGIYQVETQALINWPQHGEGRTLLGHVHILGWKQKGSPGNSASEIRSALGYDRRRSNIAWSCQFGADPIKVVPLTEERGCPSFWAAYILKAPHDAKRLKKKKKKAGVARALGAPEAKFRSTIKGYRPELAMRLFELFSQLDLFGLTGGVGAGAAILTRSRNRVRLWDKQRHAEWVREGIETIPPFDERELWARTHKRRRAEYQPFFIDGPTIAERVARRSK